MTRSGLWLALACLLFAASTGVGYAGPGAGVAYLRLTEGFWQVWRFDPESGSHSQLTRSPFDKDRPTWMSDGALIYRDAADALHRISPDGATEQPWRSDGWPAADPAGARGNPLLAISRQRTDVMDASAIWILGPGPEQRRALASGAGARIHPTWSPDGKALIYVRPFGPAGSELHRVRVADGEVEILRAGPHRHAYPAYSPDGSQVAYSADSRGDYEIYVRDLESGEERQVTDLSGLDTMPTWSPDGRRIAFTHQDGQQLEIWVIPASGTTPASPLFEVDEPVRAPAWQ